MRMELDVHGLLLRPGEGETVFDEARRTLRILVDREELTTTWFRYAPGEKGPDPHIHRRHTDAFYVLEGELELALGPGAAEIVRATAGTLVAAPPEVVHNFRNAFRNPGPGRARVLNVHTPDGGFTGRVRGG